MISYKIGQLIDGKYFVINIRYETTKEIYFIETVVDLANDYKNYIYVDNIKDEPYFVVVGTLNKNIKAVKGDIIKYSIKKKSNKLLIQKNGIVYRKATQTEFDKYNYCLNSKNDNSKMFEYVYNLILQENKKDYIKNIKKKQKKY